MTEADMRGQRFKNSTKDLLNNGDLFSLTQPEMITDIHRRFLEAGADIIETNTFGATSITQSEFFVDDPREHGGRKDPEFYQKVIDDKFLNSLAWDINEQSARQCREVADRVGNESILRCLVSMLDHRNNVHEPGLGASLVRNELDEADKPVLEEGSNKDAAFYKCRLLAAHRDDAAAQDLGEIGAGVDLKNAWPNVQGPIHHPYSYTVANMARASVMQLQVNLEKRLLAIEEQQVLHVGEPLETKGTLRPWRDRGQGCGGGSTLWGGRAYQLLGQKRSEVVKENLVKMGVDAKRINAVSYGKEAPADSGHTEDAWALNRRVHFNVD